jgi:photosystem II stability/assembly factor-like uncharacterized protein
VEWANPGPQGNDLHAVSCASETSCVAVGDLGTVVTTDDGQSWIDRDRPTGEDLRSVSCPASASCVAVGTGGKILTSADGGRTWNSRSSGTTRTLNGASCSDTSDCIAVGDAGAIVASTDGGQTWSSNDSGTEQRLNAVSCPSAGRCFAVGDESTILRSTGGNWSAQTAQQSPRRYFAVTCTSQSDCLAVGDYQTWAHTGNGGSTWESGGGLDQIHAKGVSCAGSSRCLVVGDGGPIPNTFPAYHDRSPGILGATDVHGSFTNAPDAYPAQRRDSQRFGALTATACPGVNACFAVGLNGEILAIAGLPGSSSDPPATWARQASGPVRDLTGASCPQETTCFVVGDTAPDCIRPVLCAAGDPTRTEATILTTSDRLRWTSQDPGVRERLNGVSCADAAECVAVGDLGTIVRTQDGSTWDVVPDTGSVRGAATLLGVSCPAGTNLCVAVGDHGSAFRSIDGGATWSSLNSGTDEFLNAVSCSSTSACVAVGSSGTVIRSGDGGQTWSSSSSGTTKPLLGISCTSGARCVAVGASGTMLGSSDGGQSWSSQSTPAAGADLLAVSCASSSSCTATGSEGTVLFTTNGGSSWTARGTGTDRALAAVSCPVATACYEAGELGAILRPALRCEGQRATIIGTAAGETLTGTAGDDVIVGLGGDDRINGLGGNDKICGGAGRDNIDGGFGADVMRGDAGLDTARYTARKAGVTVDIDNVADDGNSDDGPASARDNVKSDIENLSGGSGADTLTGNAGNNLIAGDSGADVMSGMGGIDTVSYQTRTVGVTVDIDNVADDGNSDDGPLGARDNVKTDLERLIGGAGADTLTGSGVANVLTGGLGADRLFGLGAGDTLLANDGVADVTIDCDGGTLDVARVDPSDPPTVGCESVGP